MQLRHLRATGEFLVSRRRLFSIELLRTVGSLIGGLLLHLLHVALLLVSLAALFTYTQETNPRIGHPHTGFCKGICHNAKLKQMNRATIDIGSDVYEHRTQYNSLGYIYKQVYPQHNSPELLEVFHAYDQGRLSVLDDPRGDLRGTLRPRA